MRLGAQLGGEVDDLVEVHALRGRRRAVWWGRAGVGAVRSPVTSVCGTVRSLDRPHRLSGPPVEDEGEGLLGDLRHRGDHAPVDDQVRDDGSRRRIVVPHAVVDRLEVPDAFAGCGVQRDEALREEVVARTVAAVVVVGPQFDRQVHMAQLGVRAERGPHRCVAGVLPGSVLPCLVSVLAGLRNGVKGPQQFARDRVVAANVSRRHLPRPGSAPRGQRGSHHHHVPHHDGGRTRTDRRAHEVHLPAQLAPQVDDPLVTEAAHRRPRRGVERHQMKPRADQEDAWRHPRRFPPGHPPP